MSFVVTITLGELLNLGILAAGFVGVIVRYERRLIHLEERMVIVWERTRETVKGG